MRAVEKKIKNAAQASPSIMWRTYTGIPSIVLSDGTIIPKGFPMPIMSNITMKGLVNSIALNIIDSEMFTIF